MATSSQPCISALYTVPLPPSPILIFLPLSLRQMSISVLQSQFEFN